MSGVVFDSLGHGAPFVAGAILLLGALFVAQSEPARVAGEAT
jgi:hypothetical protein